MKTTVFSYDEKTGLYAGETTADESPLEPGKFLIPRHATETAPPDEVPAGFAPFWRGLDGWQLERVPDVDANLDGKQDAPAGFADAPAKPGWFARLRKAVGL